MASSFESLDANLKDLLVRVARIEQSLGLEVAEKRIADPKPKVVHPTPQQDAPPRSVTNHTQQNIEAAPSSPQKDRNTGDTPKSSSDIQLSQGAILGFFGIACFIVAAIVFVKFAISSGWLTPHRQLGLLVIFGLGLCVTGFHLRSKDAPYASLLPGAGIAVWYLAAYSSHLYFHTADPFSALVQVVIVSLIAIGLYFELRQAFYLIASTVGVYLAPIFLPLYGQDVSGLAGYIITWDIVFCALAIIALQRSLIAVVAYLGLGIVALYGIRISSGAAHTFIVIQSIQFLILAGATTFYSIYHKSPLTKSQGFYLFPVLLTFYSLQYVVLQRVFPTYAPFIGLFFGVIVFILYAIAAKLGRASIGGYALVVTFLTLVFAHTVYGEMIPDRFDPLVGIALLVALPSLARLGIKPQDQFFAWLTIIGIVGYEFFMACLAGFSPSKAPIGVLLNNLSYAVVLGVVYLSKQKASYKGIDYLAWIAIGAIFQAMCGLNTIASLSGATNYGVSVLWGALAFALILAARSRKDEILATIAIGVFAVVAAKVIFVDVSGDQPLARIASLLVSGTLIYGGGLILRQIKNEG